MVSLKVASWNIRKCVGLDWRRDPRRTARVLAELDADVVALQEVDKRLGRRPAALPRHLIHAETRFEPVDVDGHEASLGWHGNAVLVSERVKVEQAHEVQLPGLEPRGAILVDLTIERQPWRIVAVHLGLMRRSRQSQKAAIREALGARTPRPTVIMGDFNEWSDNRGFEALSAFHVHAPGPTFHAARPIAALDRFVGSEEIKVSYSEVVTNGLTRMASDHLPIRAKLKRRD